MAARPADVGQAEICGYGRVDIAADDPYSLQHIPAALRNAALDEVDARMLASADEQVRAAGLLIGAHSRRGGGARIEQLARLAAGTQDPVVYAIALEGCKGWTAGEPGTCSLLSHAQWTRLDPDNAHPWLELAAQAQQRHDSETEADAMRHAAHARRSDAHAGLLLSLVDRAVGADAPALQRTLALSLSWGVQAAWGPAHTEQAYAYCGADAMVDANRRDTCEAMADTLSNRGTSLAELGLGVAIGETLGWPAQRLEPLQQEHDAISAVGGFPALGIDFSCDEVDRVQAWMRQVGTHGELQAMRDVLARSGHSVEAWSAQHRRNFALAAETAEAASLASADGATP